MGQMIKTIENELVATDDRTFRWSLKKPYPKILLALGKIGAAMMPMTFSQGPASFIRGLKSALALSTQGGSQVPELGTLGSGAARLAAILAGESPANRGVQSLL